DERLQRPRQRPGRIAYRETDPARAVVDRQYAFSHAITNLPSYQLTKCYNFHSPSMTVTRTLLLLFVYLGLAISCGSGRPPERFQQKLVILGFDGMDPALVRKWMDEGRLPNFKKLVAQGGLHRLETSHSPESPTAWASFATGANAGKHNIYDFLVRDTATYMPDLGMVHREPPRFLLNFVPIAAPKLTSLRGGTSFW